MASGILGQAAPAAAINSTVYTVPVGKTSVFNVSIVNTTQNVILVRLAVSSAATPSSSEYLEYDLALGAGQVLERGGLVAQASKNIVVYAGLLGLSVSVYGYEE